MIAEMLGRALVGLVRRLGVTTLLSLILLSLALGNIANGLAGMIRNLDTRPFWLVILGGLVFGWLLAKSPLPGWLAAPFAVLSGAGALILQVGKLESAFFSLVRAYTQLSIETWQVVKTAPYNLKTIESSPLSQAWRSLEEGGHILFLRTRHWLDALGTGKGAFDPVAAGLVWGFALWIVTVWAAWFVRRRDRVFVGIFPAGGLYAFTLYYTGRDAAPLVVMLGLTLLLVALRSYATHERRWQGGGLDRVDSPWELGIAVVGLTAALMLAAALAPSLSVRQMVRMFDTLAAGRAGSSPEVARSLGLQARPAPVTAYDQANKAALPNQKLIGPGPKLSKQPVMRVAVAGYAPYPRDIPGAPPPQIPPRYYWRSFTYDQYNGRGWYTSPVSVVDYPADITGTLAVDQYHHVVRQQVYPQVDLGGFVYAAGDLLELDAPYQVAWRMQGDALAVQSPAEDYTAISAVPYVTEAQLRSAGTDYPEWVRQRYLVLPEAVPDRVRSLAFELTAAQPTPYDQAIAIESYLRTISYTLAVPAPPVGRDVADYFLFDLHQGYCDYFATSMVVLARSVGIPARLVTGYASGGYDIYQSQFVVLEEDAHSWAEVYFPAYGWVEFEPTSGRPAIDHSGKGVDIPPAYRQPSEPSVSSQAGTTRRQRVGLGFWVFLLLLAASAVGLIDWGVRSWRVRRMTPEALVAYIYRRLYRQGSWFRLRSQPGQTPGEFSILLQLRIASILESGRTKKPAVQIRREQLCGFITQDLSNLTLLYEQSLFSPEPIVAEDKILALETWRSLQGHLRRAWWKEGGWKWWRKS
jgi:transglutaminase-like putative cysteine protease